MRWENVPGAAVTPNERQWLYDTAQNVNDKNSVIVNIGIWWGCSLWCFVEGAPDATVYGIDIDLKPLKFRDECSAVLIEDDSAKSGESFCHDVDLLFIDGSHEYEQVKKDIAAWAGKVKAGGIMAFHDYNYRPEDEKWDATLPGVKLAVNELVKEGWDVIDSPDSIKAFRKR